MSSFPEEIGELVRTIVTPLIDHVDDLRIGTSEEEDGTILVEVRVNPDDAGMIIGRRGRVINSIRVLARAAAYKEHRFAEVEIID